MDKKGKLRGVAADAAAPAKQLEIAERRNKIVRYIRSGIRNQTRMKEMLADDGYDVSPATITRDIKAVESDVREDTKEMMQYEKEVTRDRLEYMIFKLQKAVARGDLNAIAEWRRIESDRARLFGMNMPSKIAHTDPTGEKEYTGIPDSFKERFFHDDVVEGEVIEDADVVKEIEGA